MQPSVVQPSVSLRRLWAYRRVGVWVYACTGVSPSTGSGVYTCACACDTVAVLAAAYVSTCRTASGPLIILSLHYTTLHFPNGHSRADFCWRSNRSNRPIGHRGRTGGSRSNPSCGRRNYYRTTLGVCVMVVMVVVVMVCWANSRVAGSVSIESFRLGKCIRIHTHTQMRLCR